MAQQISGVLPIDKPKGVISKDVSRKLQYFLPKGQKIGHAGTLDPAASGVLPILLGKATRLADYLNQIPKTYAFEITFGSETDTLDSDGEIIHQSAKQIKGAEIKETIPSFLGEVTQIPPLFSAVKFNGKPLYKYAREGLGHLVPVHDLSRKVKIHSLTLTDFSKDQQRAWLVATCSSGTYIRALVRDIAYALGAYATLTGLVREQAGGISRESCMNLNILPVIVRKPKVDGVVYDKTEKLAVRRQICDLLVPLEKIHLGLPRWHVPTNAGVDRLLAGGVIRVTPPLFEESFSSDESQIPSNLAEEFRTAGRSLLMLINGAEQSIGIGQSVLRRDRIEIQLKRGF